MLVKPAKLEVHDGPDGLRFDLDHNHLRNEASDAPIRRVDLPGEHMQRITQCSRRDGHMRREREVLSIVQVKRAFIQPVVKLDDLIASFVRQEEYVTAGADRILYDCRSSHHEFDRLGRPREAGRLHLDHSSRQHRGKHEADMRSDARRLRVVFGPDRLDPLSIAFLERREGHDGEQRAVSVDHDRATPLRQETGTRLATQA